MKITTHPLWPKISVEVRTLLAIEKVSRYVSLRKHCCKRNQRATLYCQHGLVDKRRLRLTGAARRLR